MKNILDAVNLTDRDLITSIVNNYFILDYGIVSKVNDDKTINVIHAKIPVTTDGQQLKQLETKNLEVLQIAGAAFSLYIDIKQGDRVLLLGLKNFIAGVADVNAASKQESVLHYRRETMKAFPLCLFNDEAKIKLQAKDGTLKIDTDQKLELNGNDKQFVTWAELNSALQELWGAIQGHTHSVSTTGSATAQSGTAAPSTDLASVTLDISDAKTTSVVTGG